MFSTVKTSLPINIKFSHGLTKEQIISKRCQFTKINKLDLEV